MGTPRQAQAIVQIARKLGKLDPLNSEKAASNLYAEVLAADHATVQKVFDNFNAQTGYDRERTPSTDKQRTTIAGLEQQVLGIVSTKAWALTIAQADARIKALIQQRDQIAAEVAAAQPLLASLHRGANAGVLHEPEDSIR